MRDILTCWKNVGYGRRGEKEKCWARWGLVATASNRPGAKVESRGSLWRVGVRSWGHPSGNNSNKNFCCGVTFVVIAKTNEESTPVCMCAGRGCVLGSH